MSTTAHAAAGRWTSSFRRRAAAWARRRQGDDRLPVTLHTRRIYILPTRAGFGFAALLLTMLLAALNYSNSIALLFTFLLSGFALIAMHLCHRNLAGTVVRGVSLDVRAGEIVGIAGVSGNGQTELSLALSGLLPVDSGRVVLNGKDITGLDPARINASSFSHIPEDRHKHGIVMSLSLSENTILQRYDQAPFASRGMLNRRAISEHTRDLIKRFRVKSRDEDQAIGALSGGNQQKLVVARELARNPDFILVNQLARGIDIGAMEFVMEEMLKQRDNGRAILLISTELEELFAICDRILVMFHGEILGELPPDRTRLEELGLLMAGQTEQPALAG